MCTIDQTATRIGGPARGYQELFGPSAFPATAKQAYGWAEFLCSVALGVNVLNCRRHGHLCLASASLTRVIVSFGRITQDWFPLGLARTAQDRATGLVEVQAVADRLRIRDRHEAQADGRVLAGPGDDLALTRAEDLRAGYLRPEPGQPGQVVRVSDDVMEPDRHAVRMPRRQQ